MPFGAIADTRNPMTTTGTGTDYYSDLIKSYSLPEGKSKSATDIMGEPLQATIANAPTLQKVSDIISNINRSAYMAAPGRAEELANLQRWQAGELDPEIYAKEVGQAASTYGTGGFGVDSPAWQSAIRRALVLDRQALQEKGAAGLEKMYAGLPVTDVGKYTMTPTDYASVLDAQRARELQLAELRQKGALEAAQLAQARAFQDQEMALKQQQYELARAKQAAELYAAGYTSGGTALPGRTPSYSDWITQGYSRPTTYAQLPVYTSPRRRY